MKNRFTLSLILTGCLLVIASIRADQQVPKKWMVGTELDIVPYIFDGYYLSAIAGYSNWRVRFVRTDITTPDFMTQSGFEDNEINVNAYIVDYYFKKGFKGWWIGTGYEIWKGEVKQTSSDLTKKYQTEILTLGGGYTFRFNDYFYLNPWIGVHLPISGDKEVQFIDETFKIQATPEASIKFGINF